MSEERMSPWASYRQARLRRIQLSDISDTLSGLWVDVLPTAAHESSVSDRLAEEAGEIKSGDEVDEREAESWIVEGLKLWIKDWNLPPANSKKPDAVLAIPSKDDKNVWRDTVPLEVQYFIARRVSEYDTELTEVPKDKN